MALRNLTVTAAARNFSELVSRVHYQGDSALLHKGGKPMVKMIPARPPRQGAELAARWAGRVPLGSKEAARLERDLAAARRMLPALTDRWA